MEFSIERSLELLERTPDVLRIMLNGLSDEWVRKNEGNETWDAYEVLGHLIEGEQVLWVPRAKVLLSDNPEKSFAPFDRFAHLKNDPNTAVDQLLTVFASLRKKNIEWLRGLGLNDEQLSSGGMHPDLGPIKLSQLLATWTVHDLDHISQIARVMAYQYRDAVGPWREYLRIIRKETIN